MRLGAGTLVPEAGQDGWDRDERSVALLAAAYKRSFTPDAIVNSRKAARHWARGDKALARVHLAFAHLPRLPSRQDAFDLFWADELINAGTPPDALLKAFV